MEYVLPLEQLTKDSGPLAGGKAANIGEMMSLKLPVPEGFIVTTKAFENFLESNEIKEIIQKEIDACNVDDTSQLLETSKRIKNLIISKYYPLPIKNEIEQAYKKLSYAKPIEVPRALELSFIRQDFALVAVRSSATTEDLPTASFAGQQQTFLNVKGVTDLLNSIRKCWASLYEPRAIFYRNKHGFKHASIAVIVQKMVDADKSGVMFTIDPSTNKDVVLIEATWGLGESLVLGEIRPDVYIASKKGKILEKKIGRKEKMRIKNRLADMTVEVAVPKELVNQQVLTDEEILRLVEFGMGLEKHYKKAQDIEFAIEKGKIYIVQTRAVTTEAKKEEIKIKTEPMLKGIGSSPGIAAGAVKIIRSIEDLAKMQQGDILVTKMTSPDMVVAMSRSAAIVTDEGGVTCHASIVGREMGLPVIVGTRTATQSLKEGQPITVDAFNGLVYPGRIEIEKPKEEKKVGAKTKTAVKVNIAFPNIPEGIPQITDGVGLLRIEHMIVKAGKHPAKLVKEGNKEEYIKILMDGIRPIAQAFSGKPVWVRTLDARSDEFRNLKGGEEEPVEANPMLGWHGIRRSLDEPELLEAEFEAVKRLREEGLNNIHVMLPFVISVEEFKKAKEIAEEVGLSCQTGIMVETPAAALIIEDFCKEKVDFVSFGTNDLSQLVLGVDRNDARLNKLFYETHPAVKRLVEYVIEVCKKYNVESSICGEAPSNIPSFVEFLVEAGIDSISVNIDAVEKVRELVARIENL